MTFENKGRNSAESATIIGDEKKHISVTVTELSSSTELTDDLSNVNEKQGFRKPKFIDGFRYFAPGIWHCPSDKGHRKSFDSAFSSDSSSTFDFNSPDLIMLFSWTGAIPKHIAKYTRAYAKIYPSSPIILITTSLKDLSLRTSVQKQERLQPAIKLLRTYYRGANSILVHAFSEGGSNKAVEFAEAYYEQTSERFPCQALCLDSTPGLPRYMNTAAAFRKSLPLNPVIRFIGCMIGYVFIGLLYLLYYTFIGFENNVICQTRKRLDDEKYWNLNIPRCYLYSKSDDLIYWKDIEDHGIKAARKGMPVILVRFEDSPHCNHVKEDPDEYWDAVRDTWNMRDIEEIGLAI